MNFLTQGVEPGKIGKASVSILPAQGAPGKLAVGQIVGLVQFKGQEGRGHNRRTGQKVKIEDPQVITASIYANDPTNSGLNAGPLVALLQWGSGLGSMHMAEIDLPMTEYSQATKAAHGGIGVGTGSGVLVSVPASSFEVAARNDGNLIPSIGDLRLGSSAASAQGSASLAVRSRPSGSGQLYRTIWQVKATNGNGLADGLSTTIIIPPFARSVRIFRGITAGTKANAMIVGLGTLGATVVVDPINVAVGAPCPEIPLSSSTLVVSVTNNDGGGQEINFLYALYTIGL